MKIMRKLLTSLVLLFVIIIDNNGYAQEFLSIGLDHCNSNLPYHEIVSECISPLDKSYITTGLLADKAFPFVNMHGYNGQTDSIVSLAQWEQIHQQLYLASVTQSISLSPDSLDAKKTSLLKQEIIPIALMNLKYNQFKPYAIDSNLIMLSDGKLYDVPGRTETPYLEKRLFAASVLTERIKTGQITFRFEDNLFLTNTTESVIGVEVDFGDGRGYRNYSLNSLLNNNVTISYLQAGTKTITIRMMLSDQTVLQTKTRITIVPALRVEPDEILEIEGLEYDGEKGTGKAYILYGCNNNDQLRKPIIVSDGFDPGNENNFDSLYKILDKYDFVKKAYAEGYDFVILDYDNGTDSIQRSAFVMVSLIDTVNKILKANGSFSRLAIIGPSMGGLIARYALSYMEQHPQEYDHNTGLYVSFDSPHLGANIPLGDQCLLDFLSNDLNLKAAKKKLKMLNSAAARQMLFYHYNNTNPNGGPDDLRNGLLLDPYFRFPTQCRKIAIANGSGVGNSIFEPGERMLYSSFWASLLSFDASVWAIPETSGYIFNGELLGLIQYSRFIINAIPFDGASGGTRDVNKEIKEATFGVFLSDQDTVCFIPVISSLALQNTANVNYNVHGIPGYPYPSSNITPFDAIYAPLNNQEHVTVTEENIGWIMNEIGAFDLYLQNQTVNKATDFEARNSITTGRNVVNYIPEGDFIVQNGSDEVLLRSQDIIQLKDGTHLRPWGTGTVRVCISNFLCESLFVLPQNPSRGNIDGEEIETEHQTYTEIHESIAPTSSKKLPRSYPNPCSDYTTIEYELEKSAKVKIDVYNLMGVKMFTVEDRQNMGAGRYTTTVNTSSLPTGMYIGIVKANGETNGVLKMQVMK